MATVSEWIVREYFEILGYMVSQPCKYHVTGRRKRIEEEIDLVIVNPLVSEQRIPDSILWTTDDLSGIARGIISVYGWHTERFYPAMLEHIPEILRFISKDSIRLAVRRMGAHDTAKIICLPQLPASKKLREEILAALRQKGVDGVLLFRTMLLELMSCVETQKNYDRSDLLQIIRILKIYDLLKDRQMNLFPIKRKSRKKKQPAK